MILELLCDNTYQDILIKVVRWVEKIIKKNVGKEALKYYISMSGGGGLPRNAYNVYAVREGLGGWMQNVSSP